MTKLDFLICPAETLALTPFMPIHCEMAPAFVPAAYELPAFLKLLGFSTIWLNPFQLHACIFVIFASFIAPFGGFFASGFKRAFQIKVCEGTR